MNLKELHMRLAVGIGAILFIAAIWSGLQSIPVWAQEPESLDVSDAAQAAHANVVADLQKFGSVPVIVDLHIAGLTGAEVSEADAMAIADAQSALLATLARHDVENIKTYSHIPALAVTLKSDEALQALLADPLVAGVVVDELASPTLSGTLPQIGASLTTLLGYEGLGTAIAILDTGTDRNHTMLSGKVISEACFSTTNAAQSSVSLCPGGAPQSFAQNSALHCNVAGASCYHGTHVASIAAGVAPKANLIAMQVFSRIADTNVVKTCANAGRTSPCVMSYASDQLQALNRVYILRTQANPINVVAVNMSLGSGKHNGPCVNTVPNAYLSILASLRTQRVATVVAAGNDSHLNAMASPACISNVISVGATTKSGQIASYSNISAFTTLLAPGSSVTAAMPGNQTAALDGTSMAAPHVAGAIAALRSAIPSASVAQLQNALVSTGITIPDQRVGGNNDNKRRISLYAAVCSLITCDPDDFRTIQPTVALNGNISPGIERDPYFYHAVAGNRLSIAMIRTGGPFDPYLELYDPNGVLVAANNDGGGGVNALIANHTLQHTGVYRVIARGTSALTGAYTLVATVQPGTTNAAPTIHTLSPAVATANSSGDDFWVAIYGANFLPTTQVYWNGLSRIRHYSSSSLVYIRVYGSDIGPSPATPRTAFINVSNPAPGGGFSSYLPFTINSPTLGESELVQPALGSTLETGIKQTFVLSWTVPVTETTWRIMQNMDMRFRDETGRVMASVRVAQRPGPDSVYHVLNGAGEPLLDIDDVAVEGITGMAQDLVISDTITLHMDETTFLGSGLTAIMSPTITFGPNAVGRWRVEFRVDKTIDELGSFVQDEDILGTITIADPSCALPVDSLEIVGQDQVQTGVDAHYSLDLLPLGASQPVTITWSPMPLSGQGTTTATYRWAEAGKPVIFVSAQNCDRFAANLKEVSVYTTPSADLAVRADAPAVVAKESPVTFSLVLSNSGQITATNLVVVAQLPVGGTHVAGGTLNGNEVMWMLPSLDGYGVAQTLTMTVLPSAALTQVILSTYRVQADGGINVQGAPSATTALADAVAVMDPMQFTQLAYPAGAAYSMTVDLPVGAVADPTLLAATEAADLPGAPPSELQASGRVFRLEMLQFNLPQNPFTLTEAITVALNYPSTPPLVEASDRAGAATAPTLYHWSGSAWSDTGIVCQPGVGANTLTCILERPVSGTYALLQTVGGDDGHKVLLPLIQAQPGP